MKKRFRFNYTRATQFHDSFIRVVDSLNNSTTTFLEERFLGEGGYGTVRLFTNGNHQVAVKSPDPLEICVSDDDIQEKLVAIQNEADSMEIAYPNDFYSLSTYQKPISNGETEIDYRFIMPYVNGEVVGKFVESLNSERQLAKLILRITQEVLLINRLGIIHCDTNSGNILVVEKNHDYYMHLIDFGVSVKIGETNVDFHKMIYGSNARVETEVTTGPITRRHQLQVHACSLKWLIRRYQDIHPKSDFCDRFPSTWQFIQKGKLEAISERQSLTAFITALSLEILNLEASVSLKKICSALFNHRDKLLRKRLRNDENNESFELLFKLIRDHFYRELRMMLEAKENLLNVSTSELKELLVQMLLDQCFPPILLREIFAFHLPTEKLKCLLTEPVQDDNTLLHLAFDHNQGEMISILFHRLTKLFPETAIANIGENLQKLYNLNKDHKKTVIDLVVHLLHLYIEKEQLPATEPIRFFGQKHKNAPYELAHRIASCESLFSRMMPDDDPFQKIREDIYLPLVEHFNLKSHSKKYHDDILRNIFARMVGRHNELISKRIKLNRLS